MIFRPSNCSIRQFFLNRPSEIANRQSDSSPLWRPATVVGNRRNIADRPHLESGGAQSTDGRFASRPRTGHAYVHAAHAMIARLVGGVHRCLLCRERSAFARSAEAERT